MLYRFDSEGKGGTVGRGKLECVLCFRRTNDELPQYMYF